MDDDELYDNIFTIFNKVKTPQKATPEKKSAKNTPEKKSAKNTPIKGTPQKILKPKDNEKNHTDTENYAKLLEETTKLRIENKMLKKNLNSLILTARNQIDKKHELCQIYRKKFDDLVFRRAKLQLTKDSFYEVVSRLHKDKTFSDVGVQTLITDMEDVGTSHQERSFLGSNSSILSNLLCDDESRLLYYKRFYKKRSSHSDVKDFDSCNTQKEVGDTPFCTGNSYDNILKLLETLQTKSKSKNTSEKKCEITDGKEIGVSNVLLQVSEKSVTDLKESGTNIEIKNSEMQSNMSKHDAEGKREVSVECPSHDENDNELFTSSNEHLAVNKNYSNELDPKLCGDETSLPRSECSIKNNVVRLESSGCVNEVSETEEGHLQIISEDQLEHNNLVPENKLCCNELSSKFPMNIFYKEDSVIVLTHTRDTGESQDKRPVKSSDENSLNKNIKSLKGKFESIPPKVEKPNRKRVANRTGSKPKDNSECPNKRSRKNMKFSVIDDSAPLENCISTVKNFEPTQAKQNADLKVQAINESTKCIPSVTSVTPASQCVSNKHVIFLPKYKPKKKCLSASDGHSEQELYVYCKHDSKQDFLEISTEVMES